MHAAYLALVKESEDYLKQGGDDTEPSGNVDRELVEVTSSLQVIRMRDGRIDTIEVSYLKHLNN